MIIRHDELEPATGSADPGWVDLEQIQRVFEGFSMLPSEARVLVALLRLGSTALAQLAHVTRISRSNLYLTLDSLQAKGLAHRLPGKYAVWTTSGPQAVLAVLEATEEARAQEAQEAARRRLAEARIRLSELPTPQAETAEVFSIINAAQSAIAYVEAMGWVESEILVINQGPYAGDPEPEPAVLDALARGVKARALWLAAEIDAPDGIARGQAEIYARAGVDQRVAEELPVSVAVLDDKVTLLALRNEDSSSLMSSHNAVIRHRGMARMLRAVFDHLWDQARPFDAVGAGVAGLRLVEPEQVDADAHAHA